MIEEQFSRSNRLLGAEAMEALARARVLLFGVGGVGSWAADALVRTGLLHLTIVDSDNVALSNINRQLPATHSTLGMPKVEALRNHLLDVNPEAEITAVNALYSATTAGEFYLDKYDVVLDCIDSLSDKVLLIQNATRSRAQFFSSMGAAMKFDPTRVEVAEFWKVEGCPLARALRNKFKRSGELPARKFKCVFSRELLPNLGDVADGDTLNPLHGKVAYNGSLMPVTATFGLTLASLALTSVIGK